MRVLTLGRAVRGMRAGMVAMVALVSGAALVAAPSALGAVQSTLTYVPANAFGGPGANDGQFSRPTHVAVEPGTGNLLVADSANHRVQVFAPGSGTSTTFLTSFGPGLVTTPNGIAADRTTGAVYVSDAGANAIVKLTSDGAATPAYTADATFVSPALGTAPGQIGSFAAALAVDPTTHDLLVADSGNHQVSRYTSSGTFVSSFNGANVGGFRNLADLAVGPTGTIFVVDTTGGTGYHNATSRVERFSPAGTSAGGLSAGPTPISVTVNPVSGRIAVGGNTHFQASPRQIYLFGADGVPGTTVGLPPAVTGGAWGLAFDDTSGRLYALIAPTINGTFGTTSVQVLMPTVIPGAAIASVSGVGATVAQVHGIVAPGDPDSPNIPTTVHFEYSLNGADWTSTPDQTGITGSGEVGVNAALSGLRPNTRYSVRLVAVNDAYSTTSDPVSFTTGTVAPDVTGEVATDRSPTGAMLGGKILAYGLQTSYHFEYGATTAYGHRAPAGAEGVAGNAFTARVVSRTIGGLSTETTYHYRLVAQNSAGVTHGPDATFTTRAASEPARAYEQVSPVDKAGAVLSMTGSYQARPDGNGLVFQTRNAFDRPDTGSSPLAARYLSTRDDGGWLLHQLDVPVIIPNYGDLTGQTVLAVSEDQSAELVVSNRRLASGGVEGLGNLYRRDIASGAYQHVATGSTEFLRDVIGYRSDQYYYGGSTDFSTIVISSVFELAPDAPPGVRSLYEWHAGTLRLASILPDGTPAGYGVETGGGPRASADGSRIVFNDYPIYGALYLREGDETIPISVSQRDADRGTLAAGQMVSISRDGRYVVFVGTGGTGLTPDAPDGVLVLYRYHVETDTLEMLASDVRSTGFASDDGSTVVYDVDGGRTMVWRNGVTTQVKAAGVTYVYSRAISPNGRYYVFDTYDLDPAETGYDNRNALRCVNDSVAAAANGRCAEVYVYDAAKQRLTCASCPADGSPSTGHAVTNGQVAGLSNYSPRNVNDRGQVFFDTPTPLVAADSNGTPDVYEYRDGQVRLISRGKVGKTSRFADASVDGRDVFFTTNERLVGQDKDDDIDMYDARIGGGMPAQSPGDTGAAPCRGPECREATAGPVSAASLPSQLSSADATTPAQPQKARLTVLKVRFTSAAVHVQVRASSRGRIRVSGGGVATTTRDASKAGTYTIVAKLSKKTRAAMRAKRRVRVTVKASLTPSFGATVNVKIHRTLGK